MSYRGNDFKRRKMWKWGMRDCYRCGKPIETYRQATLEHIWPRSEGGPKAYWNLALSHEKCNNDHGREIYLKKLKERRNGKQHFRNT